MLPSAKLPFLNIKTDGRRKNRHNREVLRLLQLLLKDGTTRYCIHHANEAGMDKTLPLTYKEKWYDIVYEAPDGEIFMIEIMRVGQHFSCKTPDKAS